MNDVAFEHFPFEYDLTWMSFFQDGSGNTYLRYGGREDSDPESHLNKQSLETAMNQALVLHARAGASDPSAAPVLGRALTSKEIPTMKGLLAGRKDNCIHCHDVKIARFREWEKLGRLRKEMVFSYPSPKKFGLTIDPVDQTLISAVETNSPADIAGIMPADRVQRLDRQEVLTFGDITYVLEMLGDRQALPIELLRGEETVTTELSLPAGWRTKEDASWRSSTGAVGPSSGFWAVEATEEERKKLRLPSGSLGLKISYLWAPWAKASGIKLNDIIIEVDGDSTKKNIRQLQVHLHLNKNWGDQVEFKVVRRNRPQTITIRFPETPPD